MADIPANIHVYLKKPLTGIPANTPGKRGRPFSRIQVLSDDQPVEVRSLADGMTLTPVPVRHTERGLLVYDCAARQVWTVTEKGIVRIVPSGSHSVGCQASCQSLPFHQFPTESATSKHKIFVREMVYAALYFLQNSPTPGCIPVCECLICHQRQLYSISYPEASFDGR
jgi:hypothetical protein